MDLTWLCFVGLMLIIIPAIYYGTRSRMRYVRRIREAQARGAFTDMNTPKTKSRVRRLALLALMGIAGTLLSTTMLIQQWIRIPLGFVLAAIIVFAIIASVAGFLMRREIDRRL